MATGTTNLKLPVEIADTVVKKVSQTSTIAKLSPSAPEMFTDKEYMLFTGASEAEVVGEGQKKSSYDQTLQYVTGKRFKVQTTTRITSELRWADEDNRFRIIQRIQEDQAKAIGRALDYVVYHAVNPKGGAALTDYTALTAGAHKVTSTDDPIADMDALADQINEYDINGLALSRTWASQLRKLRVPATGLRYYPEIPMNLEAGSVDGIPAATSTTVNGKNAKTATKVLGIMGDFNLIRWGMVRDITAEIIEYGDPDQSGVDLKAYNQIAYRSEAMFSYAVLDPTGFAVLKEA